MNKFTKTMILSLLLIAALIMPSFLQVPVEAKTSGKKKVTVWNEKKLKSALKNPKVGTIEFNSLTFSEITIRSTKAKNKKLIIVAPNAAIKNTANFKSIEVEHVRSYTEAVNGNTIKVHNNHINVAEGVKVKKLVITDPNSFGYNLMKDASVKSVVVADDKHKSTFDKDTRTLTFDTVGVWYSYDPDYYGTDEGLVTEEYPIHYTAVLDESGRILRSTYSGWVMDYREEHKYNESGYIIESKRYDLSSGDLELESYLEYIYDGDQCVETIDHMYDPTPVTYKDVYDINGRLAETHNSGKYFCEDMKYTYDENGLNVFTEGSKIVTDSGKFDQNKSWTETITYDKNGLMLKDVFEEEYNMTVKTYEYDKNGKCIDLICDSYYKAKDGTWIK